MKKIILMMIMMSFFNLLFANDTLQEKLEKRIVELESKAKEYDTVKWVLGIAGLIVTALSGVGAVHYFQKRLDDLVDKKIAKTLEGKVEVVRELINERVKVKEIKSNFLIQVASQKTGPQLDISEGLDKYGFTQRDFKSVSELTDASKLSGRLLLINDHKDDWRMEEIAAFVVKFKDNIRFFYLGPKHLSTDITKSGATLGFSNRLATLESQIIAEFK
jgi:hypothetical protein